MSLLMFNFDPDQGFWVVTDTLATGEGYRPGLYQSTALVVPHLDLVVAGTGLGNFNSRWTSMVMDQVLCLDIEMLAVHAPAMLRAEWVRLAEQFGPARSTATIYHLGRSAHTGRFMAFAFRSTDDFEAEVLPGPGFGIKPDPPGEFDTPDTIDQIIELADATRRHQDMRPPDERIHIGGELVMITAVPHGTSISRIFRWPDHGDMWEQMNELLAEQNARSCQPE